MSGFRLFNKRPAIISASLDGDLPKVFELISSDSNSTIITDDEKYGKLTAIHCAAQTGNVPILCLLLLEQSSPLSPKTSKQEKSALSREKPPVDGKTPLHFAVEGGWIDVTTTLIQLGAEVDAQDGAGQIPSFYAQSDEMRAAFDRKVLDKRDHCHHLLLRFISAVNPKDVTQEIFEYLLSKANIKNQDELSSLMTMIMKLGESQRTRALQMIQFLIPKIHSSFNELIEGNHDLHESLETLEKTSAIAAVVRQEELDQKEKIIEGWKQRLDAAQKETEYILTRAKKLRQIDASNMDKISNVHNMVHVLESEISRNSQYQDEIPVYPSTRESEELLHKFRVSQTFIEYQASSHGKIPGEDLISERENLGNQCLRSFGELVKNLDGYFQVRKSRDEDILKNLPELKTAFSNIAKLKSVSDGNFEETENSGFNMKSNLKLLESWMAKRDRVLQLRQETELAVLNLKEKLKVEEEHQMNLNTDYSEMVSALAHQSRLILRQLSHEISQKPSEHVKHVLDNFFNLKMEFQERQDLVAEVEEIKKAKKPELEKQISDIEEQMFVTKQKLDYLEKFKGKSDPQELLQVETDMKSFKLKTSELRKRQGQLEDRIYELMGHGFPELSLLTEMKFTKGAKVWTDRKLSHYDEVKSLGGKDGQVYTALYKNKKCVLKHYLVGKSESRKRFEREIEALSKLDHPLIMKVEGVFYKGDSAYMQMPFYEDGNLAEYLAKSPREWQIQHMLQQIFQAVCYLHDHNIIHRDLKLDNILVHQNRPVICDFEVSRDQTVSNQTTIITVAGTKSFMAPEMLLGKSTGSPASDVWALGIIVFKMHFKDIEPILLDNEDHLRIPSHESESLRDLLQNLLQVEPVNRLTVVKALTHPYFTTSYVDNLKASGLLIESEKKLLALRTHFEKTSRDIVSRGIPPIQLEFDSNLKFKLKSVVECFSKMTNVEMILPLMISFSDEPAVDLGAVTTAFYNRFFDAISDPQLGIMVSTAKHFLPSKECQDFQIFEVIGKLIIKCLFDGRMVPMALAPSLLKYLLGKKPTFRDLETFDPVLASNLRAILAMPDLKDLDLTFDGIVPDGGDILVTNANKMEYLQLKLEQVLVTDREQATLPHTGLLNPNLRAPQRDRITIHATNRLDDLPRSHVCFYQLVLPDYEDADKMKEKMMQAIYSTATLDLI
eukprot:TRINITY_DN5497_c2_g1_i2.p1 TRINITY_DN5497_c2_g1~~TRINITY_DN5497_c2_g1_i2.p1  ORF type:complete len:1176 (-),score=464.57 TRINITY_DN5497_c2_g1_i2:108-3635(-)